MRIQPTSRWLLLAGALACGAAHAAQIEGLQFNALLSGAQMVPEVDSDARALVRMSFDPAFTEAEISFETTAELSITSASVHCGLAGEDGPAVLDLLGPGPLAEIRDGTRVTIDQTQFGSPGCEFAIGRPVSNVAALAFAMREGLVYVMLGTSQAPGGELRGQFLSVAETGELELPDDRLAAPFPR
jgi:hypothetical protein